MIWIIWKRCIVQWLPEPGGKTGSIGGILSLPVRIR
jgi:hypothetical protein